MRSGPLCRSWFYSPELPAAMLVNVPLPFTVPEGVVLAGNVFSVLRAG